MRLRGSLGLLALTAWLTACASSTTPGDGGSEGGADTITPPTDRPNPPTDNPNPGDGTVVEDTGVAEDTGIGGDDVIVPMDSGVGDDVVSPPDTGVPPMDVVGPIDTGVAPTDSGVGPADTGVDAPPPPVCPASGLNEACPAMGTGPCAPLTAGRRVFDLTGMVAGIAASCEGAQTSMGPDGAIPLVLTAASDVSFALTPNGAGGMGGSAATVALFSATGCGTMAGQRACGNTSGGTATTANPLRLTNLPAGTYWVAFSFAGGTGVNPQIQVDTTITPARPRVAGDACPGVTVPTNGTPTVIPTAMFQAGVDIGATCGGGGTAPRDVVASFTLTATSQVAISISGFSTAIAFDVQSTCGDRASLVAPCTSAGSGVTATRTISRLAAGTYFIVADYRAAGNPDISVTVNATPAPPPGPADTCPGQPLDLSTGGMAASNPVATITQDQTFACFAASRADGFFSFNAPMGQDVLVEAVSAADSQTAIELQQPCRMGATGCISATGGSRTWQRFSGLTAGASYTVHAGTNATTGNLDVRARSIAPLTTTAIAGNEACATARTIPSTGGVFTGNTAMMTANTSAPPFGGGGCNACNSGAGRDAVYRLDLTARTRVLAKLRNTGTMGFDPLLYVRPGAMCTDNVGGGGSPAGSFCADDYYGQDSAFDRTLDPGTYWFYVDTCVPFMGGGAVLGGAYSLEVITLAP